MPWSSSKADDAATPVSGGRPVGIVVFCPTPSQFTFAANSKFSQNLLEKGHKIAALEANLCNRLQRSETITDLTRSALSTGLDCC